MMLLNFFTIFPALCLLLLWRQWPLRFLFLLPLLFFTGCGLISSEEIFTPGPPPGSVPDEHPAIHLPVESANPQLNEPYVIGGLDPAGKMKSSLVLKFAENEKYSGASAFAAQNSRFPCAAFLATSDFAKQPAMAVLWGTFDDLRVPPNDAPNISCISQFTERYWNKRHLVETHPFNWTCVTNGNCEPDEIFYGYTAKSLNAAVERRDPVLLEKIRNRYKEIRESAGYWRNSNTYIVATAGLEDHWTDKAFAIVVSEGAKEWPFFLVRSGSAFGTWPREVHGKDAKCSGSTIFTNEDGYVSSNAQSGKWLKRNQNCMIRVIWRAAHQGRDPRTNAFGGPPRKRVFTWTAQDVIGEGNLLRLY